MAPGNTRESRPTAQRPTFGWTPSPWAGPTPRWAPSIDGCRRAWKAKAVTATARKIAVLYYNAMRFGMDYQDSGVAHYEQKYRERVIKQLHRRAAQFAFTLQQAEAVSVS